jgi:hypothetical protein
MGKKKDKKKAAAEAEKAAAEAEEAAAAAEEAAAAAAAAEQQRLDAAATSEMVSSTDDPSGTGSAEHKSNRHTHKAIKASYKTDPSHRGQWSNTYDTGFHSHHKDAARSIQKAYRKYRAIKSALKRKEEMENRQATGKDKLAKMVLIVFNFGLGTLALTAALAMWYYVLNCEGGVLDFVGLHGSEGTMCLPTLPNKVMMWVQLSFIAVCWLGVHGLDRDRLEWLRAYAFLLLLIVAAQVSIVGMFALDESTAMQGMQNDTYAAVLTQACEMEPIVSSATDAMVRVGEMGGEFLGDMLGDTNSSNATELVSPAADTNGANGTQPTATSSTYDELCRCADEHASEPHVCVEDFVAGQIKNLVIFCCTLIGLELIMSRLAWKYLALPVDHTDSQGDMVEMKQWLKEHSLEIYQRRLLICGVRSKKCLLELEIARIKEIGMSQDDCRKFLVAQGESKVKQMDAPDALGLVGWDKLMVSHLALDEDMKVQVSIMIKTWYFEISVLSSVVLTMYVLANQSAAYPPTDEFAVVLQSCQIFVTIFFTLEILLELVVVVTSSHSAGYFKDPWHIIDLSVLLVFWMYLLYPMFYNAMLEIPGLTAERLALAGFTEHQPALISVLRVARVLRPLRTLRMLGDVTLVGQCIGHSAHLFRDIILLCALVILLFSMIGISSFAGALHYTCITCEDDAHAFNLPTISQSLAQDAEAAFAGAGLSDSEYLQNCRPGKQLIYEDRRWKPATSAESAEYPIFDLWNHGEYGVLACPSALRCYSQRSAERVTEDDETPDYTGWGWEKPVMCVAKLEAHPDVNKTDIKRQVWQGVGEDNYGTRSFDNVFYAFYSVFIHMTGDNGMQDLPNAMWEADTTSQWLAWPMFAIATVMLTLILLNLFLAICCSVFEDIHNALEQAKATRDQARQVKQKLKEAEERQKQLTQERRAAEKAELRDSSPKRGKVASAAAGTAALVDATLHVPEAVMNEAISRVDQVIDTTFDKTVNTVDKLRQNLLDDPGIGLNNMEQEREEMHDIYDDAEALGGWRAIVIMIVGSRIFEAAVMAGICVYTLIVMGQDMTYFKEVWKIEDFKEQLIQLELIVLLLFCVEFSLKLLGLGFKRVLKYGENRLDLVILVCSLLGYVGTYQAEELARQRAKAASGMDAGLSFVSAGVDLVEGHLGDDSSWDSDPNATAMEQLGLPTAVLPDDWFESVVKISRITQLFRMTYKYKTMRDVLKKVFKTASTAMWLIVFVIFFLSMCTLIMMHVMGGGCEMAYNKERLETLWANPEECEYPYANFESFGVGFMTSFQIMTGEDWSEVMFWYYRFSPIGYMAAPYFMVMWVVTHGILFSLFVAVLLLNFSMSEEDKLPEQQQQYNSHMKKQQKKGKDVKQDLKAVVDRDKTEMTDGVAENEGKSGEDPVLGLFQAAEVATHDGAKPKMNTKSLFCFYLTSPVRVFCCKVESDKHFETTVIFAILVSCLAMTMTRRCISTNLGLDDSSDAGLAGLAEEGNAGDCEGGFDPIAVIEMMVLGVFYIELILRSISRGFFFKSGPRAPYLRSGMNQIDFLIIVVCTTTRVMMPSLEGNNESYAKMLQSMAPMASLVRHRGLRKIFGAFKSALPLITVVSIPIIFLMAILGFIGVEVFGEGQMRQCMPVPGSLVVLQKGENLEADPDQAMKCEAFGGDVTGACEVAQTIGITYLDEDEDYAGLNETECLLAQMDGAEVEWKEPPFGFDNAFQGLLALLKAATAGVMPIQNVGVNVAGPGLAPEYLASHGTIFYFVVFHLIFTFFLLNLFIGVMSTSFSKSTGTMVVTTLQRRWIQCNNMIANFVPHDDEHDDDKPMPGERFFFLRLNAFDFVSDRRFKNLALFVIILNCTVLLVFHYPAMDPVVTVAVEYLDIGFLTFYSLEMVAKMVGFGIGGYFSKGWNCFDCTLVVISIISAVQSQTSGIESLRVLRSLRVFLLAQQLPGLMSMIDTVLKCIVPALTIAGIMSVFMFLYAVAGVQLFGDAGWNHDFYNEQNNFADFPNAVKLLFQVMFGQNYMWLTADLVAEGKSEFAVTVYFISFFIIMVLINLNLFAVIVLDNFAAQNPVAQTIRPRDLWIFTHAWAEQTVGAGCCGSLQRGYGAKMMRHAEKIAMGMDENDINDSDSDSDSDDDEDYDGSMSPTSGGGVQAMKDQKKRQAKRPAGVARISVEKVTGLPFDSKGAFAEMRPYVQVYTKNGHGNGDGKANARHTTVQTKTHGHGDDTSTVYKEEFKISIDQKSKSVAFEVMDQVTGKKVARALFSTKKVAKETDSNSPGLLMIDLLGSEKPMSEASPEELERIKEKELASPRGDRSPRSPKSPKKSPKGSASPKSIDRSSTKFRPVVGQIHFKVIFMEGMAMPRFDFMGDYQDNNRFKTGGCGIEGWLWKRGGDAMFPKWERRWMWLSIPTVHDPDREPAIHYFKECDDEAELEDRGRHGTLITHTIPAGEIQEVHAKLLWDDHKEHNVAGRDAAVLTDSEFQFTRAERVSLSGKHRDASTYRFRAMCPEQKVTWVNSLKWLKHAGEPEEHDTSLAKPVLIEQILARAERTQGERNMYHNALASELDSHSIEELRHRDWLEKLKETRPDRLPIPPINERDVERVQNNPSILGMPFNRLRFLLVDLNRYGSLGCNHMNREWLLYTLFNLEMCAMNRNINKKREKDALHSHVGCYISEIRGLNYLQCLRRLCLLHYEKRHSLMFSQQVEEYQHDLHKVALNMISSAISAWVFGKALPEYHKKQYGQRIKHVLYGKAKAVKNEMKKAKKEAEKALRIENESRTLKGEPPLKADEFDPNAPRMETYPQSFVWRRLPKAHQVAVVGVASLRLESLALLFRAIKKEKPALLQKQDKEREAERLRIEALSEEERAAEEEEERLKKEEEAEKAARRLARSRGTGCLKKNSQGRSDIQNPMNSDDSVPGSPLGDSLLSPTERGEGASAEDAVEGMSMAAAVDEQRLEDADAPGTKASIVNPLDTGGADDDDESDDEDNSTVSEEVKAEYRRVFDSFGETPGAPLDKKATMALLEQFYATVLVEEHVSAKKYLKKYWDDKKAPMCSDHKVGFTFEDYKLWESDNHSLGFGERKRSELPKSRAQAWADSHQGTNEELHAKLEVEVAEFYAKAEAKPANAAGAGSDTSLSSGGAVSGIMNPMMMASGDGEEDIESTGGKGGNTVMLNPMMQ